MHLAPDRAGSCPNADGTLWIGTKGGLARFDTRRVSPLTLKSERKCERSERVVQERGFSLHGYCVVNFCCRLFVNIVYFIYLTYLFYTASYSDQPGDLLLFELPERKRFEFRNLK